MASTTAQSPATLTSTAPWWERVTVTVTDDGQTRSCQYESSIRSEDGRNCSVAGSEASVTSTSESSGAKDQLTRITFERRFTPGGKPVEAALRPGDVLLGGQVMALAIDGHGAVKHCQVVATSGSVTPQYGCDEATAERFEASAGNHRAPLPGHAGYMTVLVYGHSEHVV